MHRFVRIGGVYTLLLLFAGGGESSKTTLAPAEIGRLSREGQQLMSQRRFAEAAEAYLRGAAVAASLNDARRESLFLNAAAGCYFSGHRYRHAEAAYREAIERARRAGDAELVAVAHINLSSLYTSLSDAGAGETELRAAENLLPPASVHRARLRAQRMFVEARRGNGASARHWGALAVHAAGQAGDASLQAQVWDKLGNLALHEDDLDAAEEYLSASHRLRRLANAGPLQNSFLSLSRLRLAQGRIDEALRLAALARGSQPPSSGASAWWIHYDAAVLFRAAGLDQQALAEARAAVAGAAQWRRWVMTSQWAQTASDTTEAEATALLASLLLQRNTEADAREAFLAIEASRATSLRTAAWRSNWRQGRIPDEHGETLLALREHEMKRAAGQRVDNASGASLRARLAALESRAGFAYAGELRESPDFETLRARLAPGEAYLSFLVGPDGSWGFLLTREAFRWGALPPRHRLAAGVEAFRGALLVNDPRWPGLARDIERQWLGWAGPAAAGASHWVVSPDDVLFAFPWAALEPARGLSLVPVLSFRAQRNLAWGAGRFSAFGDAIYNRADPRWSPPIGLLPRRTGPAAFEMPRLAGSAAEVGHVAAAARRARWDAGEYRGAAVNLHSIQRALRGGSAILHLATHVFEGLPGERSVPMLPGSPSPGLVRPREMFLALSLGRGGRPELLTATSVASSLSARDALVVLSGCGSGAGDHLPGAGLQGFTSAWLAAGAGSVVASLWPVTDDTGGFFGDFYDRLARGAPVSQALAAARLAALNSGSWRAQPLAWAGYFAMGRE
jgi:tetratricopeptide (TPR) repeat protein